MPVQKKSGNLLNAPCISVFKATKLSLNFRNLSLCFLFYSLEFLTPGLAGNTSLKSGWRQVYSGLQGLFWANRNNAVVWIVSIRPPISSFSRTLFYAFGDRSCAPIITGITVSLMFHNFLNFLATSKYLLLCSFSLIFSMVRGDDKAHYSASSLLLIITRSYLQLGLRKLFVSHNPREFHVSYSPGRILVCEIQFPSIFKCQFLARFPMVTFPT